MEIEGSVNIVSPGSYVVCDGLGDIGSSKSQGLFYRDMRHLSGFVLKIGGFSIETVGYRVWASGVEFSLTVARDSEIDISRRRMLGAGMEEEILLFNRSGKTLEIQVGLESEADFLDLFEVRGHASASKRGEIFREAEDGCLRFGYVREDFQRGTVVRVSGEGITPVAEPGVSLCKPA
jgi:glycogen debranching enzyme